MEKTDDRIDQYIENAKDFAKPILNHIRRLVHQACPEVEETMKWSFPHFDYKGMMVSTAAFKEHCVLNFWKGNFMDDPDKIFKSKGVEAMGQLGKLKSIKDLPSDEVLLRYFQEAYRLNQEGISLPVKKVKSKLKELEIPEYFLDALRMNSSAMNTFENFNYSAKKEYVVWVREAKTEETRKRRLETAVELLSEGKTRNWKYEQKQKK